MNIYVLEDDATAAAHIQRGLVELGHSVRIARDGRDAYLDLEDQDYDVAIFDRMVPGLDGLSLVKKLRARGCTTPVLMLTAMGMVADRVDGLEAGADDYLLKPYAFAELVARVNALGRRPQPTTDITVLRAGEIEMNLLRREVTRAGRAIDFQPREFRLLEQLLRHSDRIVTKTMLLESVWDFDFDPRTNVVETQVSRIRMKLNEGFHQDAIQTVRGAGYMIRSSVGG